MSYEAQPQYNNNNAAYPVVYSQNEAYTPSQPIYSTQPTSTGGYGTTANDSDDTTAMIMFIVGFFFLGVIMWALVYFMYRNSPNEKARSWAKISGIFALVVVALQILAIAGSVVFGIIWAIVIASASKQ